MSILTHALQEWGLGSNPLPGHETAKPDGEDNPASFIHDFAFFQ